MQLPIKYLQPPVKNMSNEQLAKDLDTLELKPEASAIEARVAYLHLKELYLEGSLATQAMEEEISEEQRKHVLKNIEDAYIRMLKHFADQDTPVSNKETATETTAAASSETPRPKVATRPTYEGTFKGATFTELREKRGASLKEVEAFTKVSAYNMEYLENESFKELPEEVFVRGYVIAYAKFLKLDHVKVSAEYMQRYRAWKNPPEAS
jgi:hypothetical protein